LGGDLTVLRVGFACSGRLRVRARQGKLDSVMEPIALEPVDALAVTSLVDNVTDSLLGDQGPATRPSMAASPRMPARFLAGGDTDDALRAEHGFSVMVTITKGGEETRLLFDAGRTPDGLVENMRRLELFPSDIDIIVLSHGHWDHTTGIDGLADELGRQNMPVLIHPEFWTCRRLAFRAATRSSCPRPARARCKELASRSSRSASPRSCSTARCW